MPALPPSLREILTRLRNPESPWRSAALALAVAALAIFALWEIPRWQVTHTPGTTAQLRFDREDAARKTLAQILGGAVVLGTLYTGFRTYQLSREGHITDRFTKAIEQLGWVNGDKPSIEVRLGAIYALERIALDSPRDHWTIMEILTAYVRENAPLDPDRPYTEGETPRTDIQAILTVLGRRRTGPTREKAGQRLSLSQCRLCGVDLSNLSLEGINLDEADLRSANLIHANLQHATLVGGDLRRANLARANLQHANVASANFDGAHLYGSNLTRAHMNRITLQGSVLSEACLQHATIGKANLQDTALYSTDLKDAYLGGSDLRNASGLEPEQVRSARSWETAHFSAELRQALGLSDEPADSRPQ